ncbi:MAG TPA: ATP-binding protein [Polyangia bacterium]|nr:ATP-binding protein [Polyangia bacterium]
MTRAGGLKTLLRDRTVQLFALVLLPILGGLVWHIARLQRQLTAELSLADASAYSDTFHEFRSLYTTEVVDRARAAGLKVTHDYKDHDRAIPLPATFTILLGERIGQHQGGGQVRLYSDYPFPWRKDGGAHDEFERQALARLRRHPEQPVSSYEQLNGRRVLRYATAERMAERCVGCHNSLADSPKRDWKVGDVRGVLEVIRPLDSVAAHTTGALIETGIIGAIAVIALLGFALLIGRLRRNAAELHRAYAAAQDASRAKSDFLANMSHEIRTPMTAIQGYADLLLDVGITPSERLNHVQTIRRNSDHLLTLINDILDLSKIEAGKMTVENIACSPAQVVVDVASLMRVRAIEKNLSFTVKYLTPVPQTIHSDPTRLRQILTNLVGNAIKFTETGSVQILVRCQEIESARPRLSFEIADTGVGLSKAQQERLFSPFTQADASTTRKFGGTGLGLTICRRMAQLLGGDITVESLVGRGSSFTVVIDTGPLAGVKLFHDLCEAGIPLVELPVGQLQTSRLQLRGRILLAEDGADNQILITTHLRKAGAQVTIAENGRIAVEEAMNALHAGQPFGVILMDMQMPELDGYGATAKLRAKGYKGTIIALTAHAMAGDRERCINAGCDDYLTKPINRGLLLSTVQRALQAADGGAAPDSGAESAPVEPLRSEFADDPDMRDIVAAFVGELPNRSAALRDATAKADLPTVKRLAHQLKGAAGGYGFAPITDAAALVERSVIHNEEIASIHRHVEELIAVCARADARPLVQERA